MLFFYDHFREDNNNNTKITINICLSLKFYLISHKIMNKKGNAIFCQKAVPESFDYEKKVQKIG